jgi:hypothetical protein
VPDLLIGIFKFLIGDIVPDLGKLNSILWLNSCQLSRVLEYFLDFFDLIFKPIILLYKGGYFFVTKNNNKIATYSVILSESVGEG